MMAITQAQLVAIPMLASGTPRGTEDASFIAVAARDKPMIIAILPVTVGGSTRSMASLPLRLIIIPAAIDTKPDMTIPNWAMEIRSFKDRPANASAPIMEAMAAIYEKLDP